MHRTGLTVAQVKLQTAQAQGYAVETASLRQDAGQAESEEGEEDEEGAVDLAQFILRGLDVEAEQYVRLC